MRPPPPAPLMKMFNGPSPITPLQGLIVLAVLGASLWLGLEKILASEAVASIFTAALGYVFTAGVQERTARQATEAVTEGVRPAMQAAVQATEASSQAATSAAASATSAVESAASAVESARRPDGA